MNAIIGFTGIALHRKPHRRSQLLEKISESSSIF